MTPIPIPSSAMPERTKPNYQERQELLDQTPREVWREYMENGYTWFEMIAEEFSYL